MHYRLREAVRGVAERHRALVPQFTERTRRLTAAAEARALGYGGITAVSQVYGMSRATIHRGLRDLAALERGALPGAIRRPGAGRRRRVDADPTLAAALTRLVDPVTAGIPNRPCGGRPRVWRS